jgi:hypothetical protein
MRNFERDLFDLLLLIAAQPLTVRESTLRLTQIARRQVFEFLAYPGNQTQDHAYVDAVVYASAALMLTSCAGGRLSVAAGTHEWLSLAPAQRRERLLNLLASEETRTHWIAARWPGWRVVKQLTIWRELVAIDANNTPRQMLRRLTQHSHDLWISNSVESNALALASTLSELCRSICQQPVTRQQAMHIEFNFVDVRGRARVRTMTVRKSPAEARLALCNLAARLEPRAKRIKINRASVERQFACGTRVDAVLNTLDRCVPGLLDEPARQALRRWARAHGSLALRSELILETHDHALLTDILTRRRGRECVARTLSPRAVVIRADKAPVLAKRLRQVPGFVDQRAAPLVREGRAAILGSTAHLYLAARIGHIFADIVPLPYRVPHHVCAELGAQLSTDERQRVDQIAADWARTTEAPQHASRWLTLSPPNLHVLSEPARATHAACLAAIEQHCALTINYSTEGQTSEARTVDPLRIEWRNTRAYLHAYDRAAEGERTFRIDRIAGWQLAVAIAQPKRITRRTRLNR